MSSVQLYREGEDLEGYLEVVEGSYMKVALPIDKWTFYLRGKLTGKALGHRSVVTESVEDYWVAKGGRLLTSMGYTPKRAGLPFFGTTFGYGMQMSLCLREGL